MTTTILTMNNIDKHRDSTSLQNYMYDKNHDSTIMIGAK